jgi:two-component system, OmpR family, response regulator MprA
VSGVEATPFTVLVIEDAAAVREVLRSALHEAGYRVTLAGDGEAALTALAVVGADVVLLDLMLPDIDGLELCRRVRAVPQEGYLPIIMLTARDAPAAQYAGFAAGADDYVTKPFDLDVLLARVGVWTRTRQRLQAAQAALREAERARLAARLEGIQLAGRDFAYS